MKVNIGSLVRHKRAYERFVSEDYIGVVIDQNVFPTGIVRNKVEWFPFHISRGLWLNSTELEVVSK